MKLNGLVVAAALSLCTGLLAGCIVAPDDGTEDGGGSGGGTGDGGGDTGGGFGDGGGDTGGGFGDGGGDTGGGDTGGGDTGAGDTGGGDTGGGDTGGGACYGDFSLGETFYVDDSAGMGHACDGAMPRNCRDGSFINFPETGECICVLSCDTLVDNRDGADCTQDGSWTCQHIESTNGNGNHARFCVPAGWNLCTRGGNTGGGNTGGGDTGGGDTGGGDTGGGDTGGDCTDSGWTCDTDRECCSGYCEPDSGACW